VYAYIKMDGRGIKFNRRPPCTNSKFLKVARLSDKLVGRTVPDKMQVLVVY